METPVAGVESTARHRWVVRGKVRGYLMPRSGHRRRESTPWGIWLACASIAVPACDRICERVKLTISDAMSVSRIRLSDADRFSTATFTFLIVCSKRFCIAPRLARAVETALICWSIFVMDACEEAAEEKSRPTGDVAPAVPATKPVPGAA